MPKKSRLRGSFDKQHGKCAQALLKSASQHLYHIHWSLAWKLYSRKCFFLTCQILGLLVNTLPTDEKYPVLNRNNLTILIQMQFSDKQKSFSQFLAAFLKSRLNFEHFLKKMIVTAFVFPKLRTLKTSIDNCLKSLVSEDPLTSNMVNVPTHFWNLHHNAFIIFINHCQENWVGISLSCWHAKSWICLLTHWLPMKSILFLKARI